MPSDLWQTNAASRAQEFIERENLDESDVEALTIFAWRLEVDPFRILAKLDHVGEWYYRIAPSSTRPGYSIGAGYLIDQGRRTVTVISFEFYPSREHGA